MSWYCGYRVELKSLTKKPLVTKKLLTCPCWNISMGPKRALKNLNPNLLKGKTKQQKKSKNWRKKHPKLNFHPKERPKPLVFKGLFDPKPYVSLPAASRDSAGNSRAHTFLVVSSLTTARWLFVVGGEQEKVFFFFFFKQNKKGGEVGEKLANDSFWKITFFGILLVPFGSEPFFSKGLLGGHCGVEGFWPTRYVKT